MIRILYPTPSGYYNPNWLENGYLYLDTGDNFDLQLAKELQKLTDINQITVETVLDTAIPATPKNLFLLGISMDVENPDNDYPDHNVMVEVGHIILNQTQLKVTGYSKAENEIEIQLIHPETYWTEGIKNTYLDELEFGEFEYLDNNLIDNFNNNAKYIDGDPGYYMGHVFYGKYTHKSNGKYILNPADFRPLVHALKVLQLGFNKSGWYFDCPILQTDTGRRIATYVNKTDWLNTEADKERIKFKVVKDNGTVKRKNSKTNNVDFIGTYLADTGGKDLIYKFNNVIVDNGGNYDASTGIFKRAGISDFVVDLEIYRAAAPHSGGNYLLRFKLIHEYADGTYTVIDSWEVKENVFFVGIETVLLTIENEIVNVGDKIYLHVYRGGKGLTDVVIKNGATFYNTPIRNILQGGDTINVGEGLRHDSVLDYLKGVSHLFNLMFYTDYVNNTVYALTPFDVDFFGENIGGYFTTSLTNYKSRMLVDSERYQQLEKTLKNRIYCFKKSTDAKIESFKWDEHEPYSRYIDNGFDKKDESKNEVFENPYFEPTFSADTGLDFFGGTLEAPWMVDNLDGNLSFDIEPRVVLCEGMKTLYYKRNDLPDFAKYLLFNDKNMVSNIPHVFQKCNQATSFSGVHPDFVYEIPSIKLAYGYYEDDLFEIIYKRYDLYLRDNPQISFRALMNPEDYSSENFRNRALIFSPNIHTGDLFGRIIKVNSYNPLSGIAELTFVPDKQTMDECIGFTVPLECKNFPAISVSKVGQVYTFSLGGTIVSDIDTEVWQYKYEDATYWTAGNVVNTPVRNVLVQVKVSFTDGCPPITIPYFIKVQLEPTVTLNKIGNKVYAEETGVHELDVDSTVILWSENNVDWKYYNSEIDLDKITSEYLYFKTEVTYTNGLILTGASQIGVIPNPDECPNPDGETYPPTIILTKDTNSYWPYKTGVYNGIAVYDKIQFREKNKNQEWIDYSDNIIALAKCWEFRRCIVWYKDGCPPYYSQTVYSDCGACVSKATLNTTQSSATCAHEQKFENPDIPGSNTWKVQPLDNQTWHRPSIRTWIEQNAGSPVEIQEQIVVWDRWNFRTEFQFNLNSGYTIKFFGVHEADTGGIGDGYTINVDIGYNSDNAIMTDLIKAKVKDSLTALEFSEFVHYELYVTVSGTTTKTINIGFLAKHNPENIWIGINKGVDILTIEAPDTTLSTVSSSGKEYQQETTAQPILSNYSPYGTNFRIRFKISTVNYFLNDSLSNFNELIPETTPTILTDTLSAGLTDTGKKYTLGASFTGCPGSSIFQWLWGGTKKSEPGEDLSHTDAAIAFIQSNAEVICIGKCQSTGYCYQEKRIMLTV